MADFKSLVGKIPGTDWKGLLSRGLSWYISQQDPEKVRFDVLVDSNNDVLGYAIKVKTDKQNVKEAKEFWEDHVNPRFDGDG